MLRIDALGCAVFGVDAMGKKRLDREKKLKQRERRGEISAEQVFHLMEQEDRPLLLREILRRLGLEKEGRQKARELLRELSDEGKIVRIRGNRYGLPTKMNLVVGRVKCHPDGYGFVIPEKPGEEDLFISPRNLGEAMHGDRVVARVESIRKKGREGKGHPDPRKGIPKGRRQVHEGEELFLSHPGG